MPQPGRAPGGPMAGELQAFKARFFRALAHPTRIRLLEILVRGGRTVGFVENAHWVLVSAFLALPVVAMPAGT